MRKPLFLTALLILLSSCGFHLRGIADIPKWLVRVAILSHDGDKELISILKSQLEGYKVDVTDDPSKAQYWLMIDNINLKQQIVSIGASTNPRQYQLILTVGFSLHSRKGEIIRPPAQINVSRQLTVNNDRILGSNAEETVLISEMKREAALQIINRLDK